MVIISNASLADLNAGLNMANFTTNKQFFLCCTSRPTANYETESAVASNVMMFTSGLIKIHLKWFKRYLGDVQEYNTINVPFFRHEIKLIMTNDYLHIILRGFYCRKEMWIY